MLRRVMLVIPMTIALQSLALAQDMTNAQLTAEVKSLRTQLTQISANLTKAIDATNENTSQIGSLQSTMGTLTNTINEEIRKQNQILNAISERDSSGRYIPRLSAAMESDAFRRDMESAVQRSIRTHGDFEVTNKKNNYERISVNGLEIGLRPGETIIVRVPVGTVTTQLPGREKETWTITAPTYKQGIDIVPRMTPSWTVVDRPIYVNPPIYYEGFPIVYR